MRWLIVSMVFVVTVIAACSEKTTLNFPALSDYLPLAPGKTFTYRLDSTVRQGFSTTLATRYYLMKDSVESQFIDAQGRRSFRIWRYLRDTLQTQPWTYVATNVVTFDSLQQSVEWMENNLRFVVLRQPIREGFSWKGNSYIDTRSSSSPYKYMDEWNYTYDWINLPYAVRKGRFNSTLGVTQVDEVTPPGPFNPAFYQQTNLSKEVYAKGVGLIYKEFLHKTWNVQGTVGFWMDDSYGIKLNLVDFK